MTYPTPQLPVAGSYELRATSAGVTTTSTIGEDTLALILRTYAEAGYGQEAELALKELNETGEMTFVHTAGEINVKVLVN